MRFWLTVLKELLAEKVVQLLITLPAVDLGPDLEISLFVFSSPLSISPQEWKVSSDEASRCLFREESWRRILRHIFLEEILEIWENQRQQQENKPKCCYIKEFSFQCNFLYLDILTNQTSLTKVSPNCIEIFLGKSLLKLSTNLIGIFILLFQYVLCT